MADRGRRQAGTGRVCPRPVPEPAGRGDASRVAPQQDLRRQAPLARQVPSLIMDIELLVVPDCPHQVVAAELVAAAVAETGAQGTVTKTVIATEDRARERGFTGSPTILLNGVHPFASPQAPVALACRFYSTAEGLRPVPALRDLRQALKQVAARSS